MDEHKKFGAGEIIIGTFFALGVDGISILIDITGVGVIIAPVIQGFATFAITMWFRSKGDPNATKLGKQILKYSSGNSDYHYRVYHNHSLSYRGIYPQQSEISGYHRKSGG